MVGSPREARTVNRLPSGQAAIERSAVERLAELDAIDAAVAHALLVKTG